MSPTNQPSPKKESYVLNRIYCVSDRGDYTPDRYPRPKMGSGLHHGVNIAR